MTVKKNAPGLEYRPQTLQALFDNIQDARDKLGFHDWEESFFRGASESSYDLIPSLLRKEYLNREDLRWTESGLFYEFFTRAKILQNVSNDDWDILFYMRHHLVPTRLIDWTETLGVALYFAILKYDPSSSPCLWILNPYLLNEITWGVRDLISPEYLLNPYENNDYGYRDFLEDPASFEIQYPVAIYPPQKSDRMLAQRGWFTFHGSDDASINKIKELSGCYAKIHISDKLIAPIRDFLEKAGINDYTMFPDLDGLSSHLKMKYEFK